MIDRITASGKFSSPYGVSFILTSLKFKYSTISYSSFRLLTEYHSFLQKILNVSNHTLGLEFPSPYGVSFILTQQYRLKRIVYHSISVSLWSIIHSYLAYHKGNHINTEFDFRLLMEYHSFLHLKQMEFMINQYVHFRLLMEYHSFLLIIDSSIFHRI